MDEKTIIGVFQPLCSYIMKTRINEDGDKCRYYLTFMRICRATAETAKKDTSFKHDAIIDSITDHTGLLFRKMCASTKDHIIGNTRRIFDETIRTTLNMNHYIGFSRLNLMSHIPMSVSVLKIFISRQGKVNILKSRSSILYMVIITRYIKHQDLNIETAISICEAFKKLDILLPIIAIYKFMRRLPKFEEYVYNILYKLMTPYKEAVKKNDIKMITLIESYYTYAMSSSIIWSDQQEKDDQNIGRFIEKDLSKNSTNLIETIYNMKTMNIQIEKFIKVDEMIKKKECERIILLLKGPLCEIVYKHTKKLYVLCSMKPRLLAAIMTCSKFQPSEHPELVRKAFSVSRRSTDVYQALENIQPDSVSCELNDQLIRRGEFRTEVDKLYIPRNEIIYNLFRSNLESKKYEICYAVILTGEIGILDIVNDRKDGTNLLELMLSKEDFDMSRIYNYLNENTRQIVKETKEKMMMHMNIFLHMKENPPKRMKINNN